MDDLDTIRLGEGPSVLFVHGSVVGAELTWRKQRELAERWRLTMPNRPGFAGSPPALRCSDPGRGPLYNAGGVSSRSPGGRVLRRGAAAPGGPMRRSRRSHPLRF